MPTTLPISLALASWLLALGLRPRAQSRKPRAFPLNGRQEIVDVIPLEQRFAQCVQRRATFSGRRALCLTVPLHAQCFDLPLVLLALAVNRRAGRIEPRRERRRLGAGLPLLANLVELLVQLEYFLEEGRRHFGRSRFPFRFRRRQSFDREQVLNARRRHTQGAIRVVEIRRSLEAREPLGGRRVVVVI